MRGRPWNVLRVAGYGAVVGVLYSAASAYMKHPGAPLEFYIGDIVGGAVGGALLSGTVALIRSWAGGHNRQT